jgi:hypothetical protein
MRGATSAISAAPRTASSTSSPPRAASISVGESSYTATADASARSGS